MEYHGEIRAVLFSGASETSSTSNYIIDLAPGESTSIRFTDAFNAPAGDYTMAFVNDDGQKVCTPIPVKVDDAPELGNVSSVVKVSVTEATAESVTVKAIVRSDAMFQGLLYAFILNESGAVQAGCLYPEYLSLDGQNEKEVVLRGEFENGQPGNTYLIQLATYSKNGYTFLDDDDSKELFTLKGESSVITPDTGAEVTYRYYDFNGFEVDPKETKYYKKVKNFN